MRLIKWALPLLLAACAVPPPDAYISTGPAEGQPIGRNAANEACILQRGTTGALVFCGTWQQPSARLATAGPATASTLQSLATTGSWRTSIDSRLSCGSPATTTILGSAPAYILSCTRKAGGWPEVAMVALIGGTAYTADGIEPAAPVIPRAIGVLSGTVSAEAAPTLPPSGADALVARRLAAQAFGAGDVGQYEQLMRAGTRANLAENFAAAEQAYRAALAVQQKALGKDNPERVSSLLPLALQLSNEERFAEADAQFAEADRLAPRSADPVEPARLLHYRALHAYNQHRADQALPLLRQAEQRYAALLPPEAITPRPRPGITLALRRGGPARINDPVPNGDTLIEPAQQSALIGLIETRRYQALALRDLGRPAESDAAIHAATTLAVAQNMRQPVLAARLFRTDASSADARGERDDAAFGYSLSSDAFSQALPGTRPVAATLFLHAAQLRQQGSLSAALANCRRGAALLRELKTGLSQDLVQPCLTIYAESARGRTDQTLLAEMFETAQLAQGGITSQQIAQSAVRLAESARDPRVGQAIRARQDAGERLADLERERDLRGRTDIDREPGRLRIADLDASLTEARKTLAESDSALQAASPGYGQLVQEVTPAAEVQSALRPNEAFIAITLGGEGGWVFAVRDHAIIAAPLGAPPARIAALVKRLRTSVEPGASGPPPFDTEAAQSLYAATLGTIPLDGVTDLVIAPSGPLLSLPFSILLTGPAGPNLAKAPWLIRRMSVAHVPAASNFVALRRIAATSRATRPWFGMGGFKPATPAQARRFLAAPSCAEDARLFAGLPSLPFARPELAAAQALLGASPHDELLDQNFTPARIRQASLKDYRVLHVASHALLPAELGCIAEPAIITSLPQGAPDASGSLLTSSAIMALDLDADTVILSACNSAGPQGPAGESLSGLARAFFYAGARSLLVTHWSINDQTTAYLVAQTLQRARTSGMAASLRGAQLALLDEAGTGLPASLAHPFYWGAFALIGEGTTSASSRMAGL